MAKDNATTNSQQILGDIFAKTNPEVSQQIINAKDFESAKLIATQNMNKSPLPTSSLIANSYVMIADQICRAPTIERDKLFGCLFKEFEGGEFTSGGGLAYNFYLPNSTGGGDPVLFNDPNASEGQLILGKNGVGINPQISFISSCVPLYNAEGFGMKTTFQFSQTIPKYFMKFIGLSPIKFNEILNGYLQSLANAKALYEYSLGNQLLLKFAPTNEQKLTGTNILECLNSLVKLIIQIQQLSDKFNSHND